MKEAEKAMKEILAIKDSRKAYVALSAKKELSLDEGKNILEAYMEKYGVELHEMAYYPNGEQVVKPEVFW